MLRAVDPTHVIAFASAAAATKHFAPAQDGCTCSQNDTATPSLLLEVIASHDLQDLKSVTDFARRLHLAG